MVISTITMKNTTPFTYLRRQSLPMILILFYLSLIFHGFTVATTGGNSPNYEPPDNKALDCGSQEANVTINSRSWGGDMNSKEFPLEEGQNKESTYSEVAPASMPTDRVPYGTARLSLSEFFYIIPVNPGPKFIRLHFYNSAYKHEKFDISKAFFSVKADNYTLLSNFSVSLTARALRQEAIVQEFCVPVEKSRITITFTPSSSVSGAFAFVNGIEVVSMPTNLYYPHSEDPPLRYANQKSLYTLENDKAMVTMFRVNIGGQALTQTADTGMFRNWEAEGNDYLLYPGWSVLPVLQGRTVNFSDKVPDYTAPEGVYLTARSMGHVERAKILSYRLTWEFRVHPRFDYLVRLHFCEIQKEIKKPGDRVFHIYIAEDLVEEKADVIAWSGGQYVPTFKDYAVSVSGTGGEKTVNLTVALEAISNPIISQYADAILNGIEIFKLSDYVGNLAGPNPDPISNIAPDATSPKPQGKRKKNPAEIIGIVLGVVSSAIILSVVGFLVFRRGRKVKFTGSSEGTTWWGPISFTTTKSSKNRGSSSLPSDLCRYFSLAEIKAATNNFEDIFIIGVGGFGNVYKGYIDNGTTLVAIKRLKPESSQGFHEFKTEIEMLSHLRHRHLVSLIGYCNEGREMILVYDYMAHGTLRNHLYNTENPPLTWKQRLEICIGAARGLHYLHTGSKYTIIHRDVKTTNILLDEKWVAKVSDFGLSKTGPTSMSKAHVSTVVKGSIGYLDPEYYRRQQLTEKSDVYSFGVVLCEVLCGRPPIVRTAERKQVSLAEWARSCYYNGTLHQIIDPQVTGKIAPECLKKYGEIAMNCMLDNGTERPSMNDVVWGLEFALQLQQNAEDNDSVGGAIIKLKGEEEVAFMHNHNSDGTFSCSWEDTTESKSSGMTKMVSSSEQGSTTTKSIKGMSGTVFSEINDPKGR